MEVRENGEEGEIIISSACGHPQGDQVKSSATSVHDCLQSTALQFGSDHSILHIDP